MSSITFRAGWGARYGQGDYLVGLREGFTVHHSWRPRSTADLTPEQEVELMLGMERHHVVENGWDGIGYHWAIFQSGRIYECRGWDRVGAHARGANRTMYGVVFVIDGDVELPSAAAITSFRLLVQEALRTDRVPANYRIDGHRDHMARDCPGELLYAMLPVLRHDRLELPRHEPEVTRPGRVPPAAPALPHPYRIVVERIEAERVARGFSAEQVRPGLETAASVLKLLGAAGVPAAAGLAEGIEEYLDR